MSTREIKPLRLGFSPFPNWQQWILLCEQDSLHEQTRGRKISVNGRSSRVRTDKRCAIDEHVSSGERQTAWPCGTRESIDCCRILQMPSRPIIFYYVYPPYQVKFAQKDLKTESKNSKRFFQFPFLNSRCLEGSMKGNDLRKRQNNTRNRILLT